VSHSLNVPVPGRVERLASELRPELSAFDRVRTRHTLLVKRLAGVADGSLPHLRERLRELLSGAPAFEARVTGVDYFAEPTAGPGPVVYLAVESPGLSRLHRRLVGELGAVEGVEGEAYVPHVTLARGGEIADAERLAGRPVEPVTWTVSELAVFDADRRESVARFGLPA